MIAAWMLYCILCAVGLSVAASLAERALLAGPGPVRHVWLGAVALSLCIPAAALLDAPHPRPADGGMSVGQDVLNWGAMLARADRPLVVAWCVLSSALALYFFGGIAALSVMRRRWRQRVVLGVPVLVSERTGPALVGAVAPVIVVPKWALAMERPQLALILRHELEHRRAGDGRLLTLAQLALIAMPWNVALWWQLVRLRQAVELDCDARVLRDADPRSYGNLLLDVVRPRRRLHLMSVPAFAERATQLDRRIRAMTRRRDRASRGTRALAGSIALSAMTIAWVAPHPPTPACATAPPAALAPVTTSREHATPETLAPRANDPERPVPPGRRHQPPRRRRALVGRAIGLPPRERPREPGVRGMAFKFKSREGEPDNDGTQADWALCGCSWGVPTPSTWSGAGAGCHDGGVAG